MAFGKCKFLDGLGILPDMDGKKNSHEFDYYVFMFFILAFIGWIWEVLLFFFTEHAFINRGVYRGPYLPVYGVGGLLLLFLLRPLKRRPFLVFCASAVICSALEYFTGYFLEKRWGLKWWDYSGHFMNLHGRICLAGAVIFGLGGMALICFCLPAYERLYGKISPKWRIAVCIILLLAFVADATYCAVRPNTGRGISSASDSIL